MSVETQHTPQAATSGEDVRKSRGCLYGCLVVGIGAIAFVLCAGFGGYWFITRQVTKYTADQPVELPTVIYTEEQLTTLHERMDAFHKSLEEGPPAEESMILTSDDINALINENEDVRGRVFVKIEDNAVKGEVSVPTDAIPGGKNRFFNASATFNVTMENGVLIVTLKDAEVKGEKVPQQFIESAGRENLAKDMYKNPENAELLSRFESVRIEDDKMIFTLKKQSQAQEPKPTEAEPATAASPDTPADSSEAAPANTDDSATTEPSPALEVN